MVKINVLDLENPFLLVSGAEKILGQSSSSFTFVFATRFLLPAVALYLLPKMLKGYPKEWKVTQKSEKLPQSVKSYPKELKVTQKSGKLPKMLKVLPKSVKSYPKVWKDTKNVERIPKRVKSYPKCWKVTKRLKMLPKSVKSYPKCWVKSYPNVLNGFQASIAIGLCFLFVLFRYSNIWGIHGLIQPATNSLTSQASILPIDRYHTM